MSSKQFIILMGAYVIFAGGITYIYKKFLDRLEEDSKFNKESICTTLEHLDILKEDLKNG